jgi:hypothetical protein
MNDKLRSSRLSFIHIEYVGSLQGRLKSLQGRLKSLQDILFYISDKEGPTREAHHGHPDTFLSFELRAFHRALEDVEESFRRSHYTNTNVLEDVEDTYCQCILRRTIPIIYQCNSNVIEILKKAL